MPLDFLSEVASSSLVEAKYSFCLDLELRFNSLRLRVMSILTERISREIESVPEPLLSEVLDFVLFVKSRRNSADADSTIRRTPGVCGGEACIRMTRVAVWMLEDARRAGVSDADLLCDYPDLTEDDLVAAKQYASEHREEIDSAIDANQNA